MPFLIVLKRGSGRPDPKQMTVLIPNKVGSVHRTDQFLISEISSFSFPRGKDGKKRTEGNPKGTPQGGVISPLLANIYLHVLDQIWKVKKVEERFKARLVRYADDCAPRGCT